jgi:phosphatidylglycerophosphate synthase
VYVLARPLARTGVRPDVVTLGSVGCAAVAVVVAGLGGRWALGAGLLVLASAVLDGVDGAVALLSDRTTRWGFLLDSLADRVCEALFVSALWLCGAPGWLCVLAGGVSWLHEYVRARANAAGMEGIGVVTVGERPTRAILAVAALLAAGALPGGRAAAIGVALWALLGVVGLAHLLIVARRSLR